MDHFKMSNNTTLITNDLIQDNPKPKKKKNDIMRPGYGRNDKANKMLKRFNTLYIETEDMYVD